MASIKISELPAASAPLTGTELVPVVQAGVTEQVSVANLTAGRTVAAAAVQAGAVGVTGLTASAPVFTDASKTLTSAGTVPVANGGTGKASWLSLGMVYANSTTSLTNSTNFTFDGSILSFNTGGKVLLGATASASAAVLQTFGSTNNANVGFRRYSNDASGPALVLSKTRDTTTSGFTTVQAGDQAGTLVYAASQGTAAYAVAVMDAYVDPTGTVSATSLPGMLTWATVPDGAVGVGSERMRLQQNGNLGVGTTSPTARLTVKGAGTTSATTGLAVQDSSNNNLFVVRNDGNVGIGTASPVAGARLAVVGGGTQLSGGTTAQEGVRIQRATGYATFTGINNDNNAYNGLQFFTGASAAVTIDTSGNVGIGTASPAQLVEASLSQNGKTQVKVTNVNAGASASAGVLFGTSSGENGYIGANGGAASSALGGANAVQVTNLTANPLVLATNAAARLTIDSTGGITSSDLANAVGYKGTPLNEQSAAYTLVIGDMGKSIVHPASDNNARTFTIPANGTVAFPVGTTITFINMINTVTISITTDTMYLAGTGTTGSRTLAAYGMATAVKMTSTTWIISGNGLT